ncbi:uncharacterized protein LOC114538359 isoform X2 [Dendronephthya gigantea]|uniref:uncharacterized protein LOC114538359 isoform X2 n=1 Tax=Dendronephthya gigantea TaxID=151771 RepID=UPI00106BE43C|nr:uncharacterized protein LOC114538359 isoform X2 [Dendronephthya gigantea]
MTLLQVISSLLVFSMFCDCFQFNTRECVASCENKRISSSYGKGLCDALCVQDSIDKRLKQDFERKLPKPAIPRAFEIGWERIGLDFNSTELTNYSGVRYILEVKPDWKGHQKKDVFTVYPYIQKYHYTNETTYFVKNLEPNTDYQFRVMAVTTDDSSTFSNWSNTISTTKSCSNPPCGVSKLRVEITTDVPYKGMVFLKSVLYWEPTTLKSSYQDYIFVRTLRRASHAVSFCGEYFENNLRSDREKLKNQDIFTNRNLTTYTPRKDETLYYDCWYTFELYLQRFFWGKLAVREWKFYVPGCITVNTSKICGCPYVGIQDDTRHYVLNVTITSSDTSVIANVNWNDNLWRNDVNVTYYLIELYDTSNTFAALQTEYYDAHANVHNYNASFTKLNAGQKHRIRLSAFHGDHCVHHKIDTVLFFGIRI